MEASVEEARNLLLRIGRKRFGEPDEDTLATFEAITTLERLERLADRLLDAENWNDLMAETSDAWPFRQAVL